VIATVMSRFREAAGLKKTGEVGGGSSTRLLVGTINLVPPSRCLTDFIYASGEGRLAELNDSTSESARWYVHVLPNGKASGLGGIWLVTGPPSVGKSTLVSKVIVRLKSAGVIVGGCTTYARRSKGARVGFEVLDLSSGRKGELASVDSKLGPRVGRYRVNLTDLAGIGAAGLNTAAASSELIVIDEVGPMELVSPEFRRAVKRCIDSGKPVFAVVHERLDDDLLNEMRTKAKLIVTLSVENRDTSAEELGAALLAAVGGPKSS